MGQCCGLAAGWTSSAKQSQMQDAKVTSLPPKRTGCGARLSQFLQFVL